MKLIADCGSTKIEWCLVDNGNVVERWFSPGVNALMQTEEEMRSQFQETVSPVIGEREVSHIYFYGAGCVSPEVCGSVRRALADTVAAGEIEVDSDMLAVARALCQHEKGIACIMGTGSNSCVYDGTKIIDAVSPLGYILGDEGSGAVLGKILVGDVLKRQLPEELCQKFLEKYDLDRIKIINRVYREPRANAFLASLTPFLLENIEEPSIHRLVLNAFKLFFVRNISNYADYKSLKIHFVGSIGYYYREVLEEAAAAVDCLIGKVVVSPMDGLIKYHG